MIPFATGLLLGGGFQPIIISYTAIGTKTVSIPSGATFVTIESIAGGVSGTSSPSNGGGAGGAYAKTTKYSVNNISALFLTVPANGASATVQITNSSGTIINKAAAGSGLTAASASASVGDIIFIGGNGVGGAYGGGGGAGGPNSNGGNGTTSSSSASSAIGGVGGGGNAGNGGRGGLAGVNYGGGGGYAYSPSATYGIGAQGIIVLRWS